MKICIAFASIYTWRFPYKGNIKLRNLSCIHVVGILRAIYNISDLVFFAMAGDVERKIILIEWIVTPEE